MRVTPRPALEPYFAPCEVCKRYVSMKPTNWKEMEMRKFHAKAKMEPAGRPSIKRSSDPERGAWIVVSQYGGTASAWATVYDYIENDQQEFDRKTIPLDVLVAHPFGRLQA